MTAPLDPEVVYEDDALCVVYKPSGLPTTAPGGGRSLARWVAAQRPGKLHATSRLDAPVTGLVTFARTKRANAHLLEARRAGRYGRGYLALALGELDPSAGVWERSIAIDPRDRRLRIAVDPGERGQRVQAARTTYRLRERVRFAEGGSIDVALALWLTPHTGRTHQLRVHAADAGAPLLGDVRYGGPRRVALADGRVVRAARVMLHCAWLRLPRLEGEGDLELSAPAPDDLRAVWIALGGSPEALEPSPSSGPGSS